ncbi:MAG TPA: lytic murein transglycosylase B [Luteimonas sp.]|nr:lytic murein transglycosylase B [Luteimonas sp.]
MIRRASFRLLSCVIVCLALAACATQARPPASRTSTATSPASTVLLPPVPQPPERPLAPPSVTDPAIPQAQRIDAFVDYTARTYGVDPATIRAQLAQAQFKQNTITAISRPAEAVRPWRDYRPIFLTDARIEGGKAFYAANRDALERVAASSGVPAEYIVAIIGVETSYGKITGNTRVLDALYTLAFGWPKRAPFFAGELAQLFALGKDEGIDVATLTGSYAGAMGWGQFMPSSYRNWAVDGDRDGRRDLINNTADVFASIANYFVVHGWQRGGPVVARASRDAAAADFISASLDPVYPLAALAQRGYRPQPGQPRAEGATLVTLDGDAGKEYWLGYRNFYVITRYNHSPMYAMAVQQLAQSIRGNVPR